MRRLSFHFLSVFFISLVFYLSYWQFERKQVKLDLIEQIEKSGLKPALNANKQKISTEFEIYRKYIFTGDLLFDKSIFVFTSGYKVSPVRSSGAGYWLVTPLMIEQSSRHILVNLGFIAYDKFSLLRKVILSSSVLPVSFEAKARAYNDSGFFTPSGEIDKKIIYDFIISDFDMSLSLDFVRHCYFQLTSYLEELSLPLIPEKIILPDNHLQYALTWLLLGVCLLVMYILILRRSL